MQFIFFTFLTERNLERDLPRNAVLVTILHSVSMKSNKIINADFSHGTEYFMKQGVIYRCSCISERTVYS